METTSSKHSKSIWTMVLQNSDYTIQGQESITIKKETLERLRDHYLAVAAEKGGDHIMRMFYVGKADICIDLLKHFDMLEV